MLYLCIDMYIYMYNDIHICTHLWYGAAGARWTRASPKGSSGPRTRSLYPSSEALPQVPTPGLRHAGVVQELRIRSRLPAPSPTAIAAGVTPGDVAPRVAFSVDGDGSMLRSNCLRLTSSQDTISHDVGPLVSFCPHRQCEGFAV